MILLDRIRDVLLAEWDPLGLADAAGTPDDYDAYAREVRAILSDPEAGEGRIAHYLDWVERHTLRLQPRPERAAAAAAAIMALKRAFDESQNGNSGGAG